MKKIIQVHIYKGEKYYVAECLDLPVVTQGKIRKTDRDPTSVKCLTDEVKH